MQEGRVTKAFLDFAEKYKDLDNIPTEVSEFAKTMLLDAIGNALGGIASDKGKIGVEFARRNGGTPESTVIGVGGKVSATNAAFANSELLNGLDYDPVPHISPIVIPPLLAVAEAERKSGRELLAAICVSSEIARRLSYVLLRVMGMELKRTGSTPEVFGNSNEHLLGAAVGCGLLMGLNREKLAQALGISAYYCSLPVCKDWEDTMPKSMIKYTPTSWLSLAAVASAQMAGFGYTGNPNTLDSRYGFPVIYCRYPDVWDPDRCTDGIGEKWVFTNMSIKPYPACRFLHSSIDGFTKLMDKHHFNTEEIKEVRCNTSAFVAHPDQLAVSNQVDAQFSGPYAIAMIAKGYKPGPAWQSKQAIGDQEVQSFMKKVKMIVDPMYYEKREKDPRSWYARVEVDARGETYSEEIEYSWGTNIPGYALTREDVIKRFSTCAETVLTNDKMQAAIDIILHIEEQDDLEKLFKNLSL